RCANRARGSKCAYEDTQREPESASESKTHVRPGGPSLSLGGDCARSAVIKSQHLVPSTYVPAPSPRTSPALEKTHLLTESPEPPALGLQVVGRLAAIPVGVRFAPGDQALVARDQRRHLAALEFGQGTPALVVRAIAGLPLA